MAESTNEGTDPKSKGEENDQIGTGYIRLEGELTGYRAEFECLAKAAADGERKYWIDRGRDLLDKADKALNRGKIEQGWYYLHAAKRLEIYGVEAIGGKDALRAEARELLTETTNVGGSWRADAVRARIANNDGTPRDDLTGRDLRSARALLDEEYQRIHLKRKHLQDQFGLLKWSAMIAVILFLGFASLSIVWNTFPSPFFDFSNDDTAESVWFIIYIVVAGVAGASLFGLRSLREQPVSTSTPQYLTSCQTTMARVIVGAISALFVFFFLRSELLTVAAGTGVHKASLLIAVAFVAGYSERFVPKTVETVISLTEPAVSTNRDGELGQKDER